MKIFNIIFMIYLFFQRACRRRKVYQPCVSLVRRYGVSGNPGFSLIELAVVLVLVGVLTSAMVGRFKSITEKTNFMKIKEDILELSLSVDMTKPEELLSQLSVIITKHMKKLKVSKEDKKLVIQPLTPSQSQMLQEALQVWDVLSVKKSEEEKVFTIVLDA